MAIFFPSEESYSSFWITSEKLEKNAVSESLCSLIGHVTTNVYYSDHDFYDTVIFIH